MSTDNTKVAIKEENKFTEKTNLKEETKLTEETKSTEDKSLLTKTKDTLIGLKNQAEEFFFNRKKDEKIQGMSRVEFEATKAKLESILHFKKAKDLSQQQQQQFENTQNLVSVKQESNLSRFGTETISGANMEKKYEKVDKQEFAKAPEILHQKTEFHDDKKDEIKFSDKNETHVLPTLHVEEKPVIIEKEIEYEKPVEIKQTIIHKEKPIIIEKPIIKEKHEHYREATEYEKKDTKIVKEKVSEQDVGNQDTEALLNLRKERLDQYSQDTAPIVQKEKQFVQLETDVREQPTEVHEKKVVYQQPVEIQKTHIEKIKPKVREEVTLEKEHIHEKLAPEIHQENVKKLTTQQYFSQDATAKTDATSTATATANATVKSDNWSTDATKADTWSTTTNDTTTTQRDKLSTNLDTEARIAAGEQKRKEQVL